MAQHIFKYLGIAFRGHQLITITKITVISAQYHRHTADDRTVYLQHRHTPLFCSISFKYIVKHKLSQFCDFLIFMFHQFQNSHSCFSRKSSVQFCFQFFCLLHGKQRFQRSEVKRNGNFFFLDFALYSMFICIPLSKLANIAKNLLIIGMEDMGTINMDTDTHFIFFFIHISTNVRSFFQNQHLFSGFCQLSCRNGARKARTSYDYIGFSLPLFHHSCSLFLSLSFH